MTRTGYTFTGWSPSVPSTVPAGNATYTAQWKVNQYTLTFDANGGEGGKTVTQNYGTSLTAPGVTRTGYTFTGWSPSVPSAVPAGNATYTAQWKANQYTVTFNANGGEGEMADQTFTYDVAARLGTSMFHMADSRFVGWATNETDRVVFADRAEVLNLSPEDGAVIVLYSVWGEAATFAEFPETEVLADEGGTAEIRVVGGSADAAASVKVYLTYNTAAAADVDWANGAIDGVVPKGGLKFPLTLTWEKGVVGERVITIPSKSDKPVEDDEFFTLQLADAEGMDVGEARVCTVTIHDLGYDELAAKVADDTATKSEVTAWNKLQSAKAPYVRGLADPADGGKVSGSGYCAEGKKVTLKAAASKNYAFVGWLKGSVAADSGREPSTAIEYIATTPTLVIDRTAKPAANSKTSTTVTEIDGDVTYFAVFKSDPKVSVSVEATDKTGASLTGKGAGKYVAGTITGAGKYAPGKKVTLKATANKGYVFAGWNSQSIVIEGNQLQPSITFEMPSNDVEYVARFVTAAEDAASIALALDGVDMRPAEDGSPYQTNVWAGVYLEWPVEVGALSLPTVAVSGLPSGLKFTAKDIIDGKTKEVTVPANTIYGAPTAASKIDTKTGAVKPSVVKVTVTTAGKAKVAYELDVVVDALPGWAVGTFDGAVLGGTGSLPVQESDVDGLVSMTVAANGKISGKLLRDGLTWTLSAPSFDAARDAETGSPVFAATVVGKSGKQAITNEVEAAEEAGRGVVNALAANAAGGTDDAYDAWAAWQNLWKTAEWKDVAKPFAKAPSLEVVPAAPSVSPVPFASGAISLKFAASGAVTASGKFVTGQGANGKDVVYSATCSSVLIPVAEEADGNYSLSTVAYSLHLYFPPNDKKGFGGHVAEIALRWDGTAFSLAE